jgi:hypothetical protein
MTLAWYTRKRYFEVDSKTALSVSTPFILRGFEQVWYPTRERDWMWKLHPVASELFFNVWRNDIAAVKAQSGEQLEAGMRISASNGFAPAVV